MGRAPCCDKANVKRGPWSPEEDAKLKDFIDKYGTGGNWIALPHKAGLKRCGKSCRLRWLNYLRPNIKHGDFSDEEDRIICSLYASIGSRWSIIAAQLPGRTDNDIKNYWNTKLKKKLLAMLPFFQKKPSLPLQSPPPPPYDHHKSDQFMATNSSSFYNYTNPSFMNVNNSILNSLLLTTTTTTTAAALVHDHINVANPSQPPPPPPNPWISYSDNCYDLGFQDGHQSMYNNSMQEYKMLIFGGHEVSTACSSSEGGSCISYGNYNKDLKQQRQIKQEDQFALQGFGDQDQSFILDHHKSKGYLKNYASDPMDNDPKQLIGNDINNSNYLFHGDDENKTTHDDEVMCYYY